jgi:hypothetical protein
VWPWRVERGVSDVRDQRFMVPSPPPEMRLVVDGETVDEGGIQQRPETTSVWPRREDLVSRVCVSRRWMVPDQVPVAKESPLGAKRT